MEDKYIKLLKTGLNINDRVYVECVVPDKCTNLKFDIIWREEAANSAPKPELKPSKTRRGMHLKPPPSDANETNESVAVRVNVDYTNRRITQKSFLKKAWAKHADTINSPGEFDFARGFETLRFFIDIDVSKFHFGFVAKSEKEVVLSKYAHSRHNIELFKLNCVRIAGVGLKLKELKVTSKDHVHLDTQISDETEHELKQRSFTLKQLIRQLHINKPVEHVMALIGKKYPDTFEEFMKTKLPGEFDSTKSGQRMKLPTPETWETQISLKGNKAHVWEQLIDNKKLPYMAMLRNLRNMIKTGISDRHHQWVIKKLQDEGAVIHSRQFPFRFFTAYEVLDELEDEFKKYVAWTWSGEAAATLRPSGRGAKKLKKGEKAPITDMKYDEDILRRYKVALDNALKVATTYNVSPIRGSTAIFLNLGAKMNYFLSGSAKSLGKKVSTIADIAALLALMFKFSCEHSKLIVFTNSAVYTDLQLEQGTILDNMKSLTELKNMTATSSAGGDYPHKSFQDLLALKEHYDNIIFLSNGVADVEYHKAFLRKYRSYVNESLMFVNVNLSVAECNLTSDAHFDHDNDISITGFSDAILRFVAERGNQGQRVHIENIDKSYELPATHAKQSQNVAKELTKIERPKFRVYVPKLEWKNVKVFISSTFRDMHAERDILTRTVFPMLRAKLSPYLINVHEIDMRWGITEAETRNNETLDLCLKQILEAQYFVSMLGERYGQVLDSYEGKQKSTSDI